MTNRAVIPAIVPLQAFPNVLSRVFVSIVMVLELPPSSENAKLGRERSTLQDAIEIDGRASRNHSRSLDPPEVSRSLAARD